MTGAPGQRCKVCGGLCCGPNVHGLYKSQLADTLGEIRLSFDPIFVDDKLMGFCFLATCDDGTAKTFELDSVLIQGDCGIA